MTDALHIEDDGDTVVLEVSEYDPADFTDPVITALDCVRSFDHGLRTSDELMMDFIALAGDLVMARVLLLLGLEVHLIDCTGLAAEEFHVERDDYTGSWRVAGEGDELFHRYQVLSEAYYEYESMLGDCGFVVETSADAGMTWIYVPTAEWTS